MYNHDHTIEDKIVQDTYIAFAQILGQDKFFSGGMALQMSLPTHLHRGSNDVDMNGIPKLSFGEFKTEINPGIEVLTKDMGYRFKSKKRRHTYDLMISNTEGDTIILQYPNKGSSIWGRHVAERENANTQSVQFKGVGLRVLATEDSILHKLVRSSSFISGHDLVTPNPDLSLKELKRRIERYKEDYTLNSFNLDPQESMRDIARIRLLADIFDIKALTIYKGLDKQYFLEGMEDYSRLREDKSKIVDDLQRINPNAFR